MHSYSALPGAFFFTLVLLFTIAFVTLVSKWKVYAKLGMNDMNNHTTGLNLSLHSVPP